MDLNESIKNVVLNEAAFYLLPGHVIGNELYSVNKQLGTLVSGLTSGNDYDPKVMKAIIKSLQSIDKQAKKFNDADEVPVAYQYKKK